MATNPNCHVHGDETQKYWQGWKDALDAMETRIEALQKGLDSTHEIAHNILFDMRDEVKDLKTTALDTVNLGE